MIDIIYSHNFLEFLGKRDPDHDITTFLQEHFSYLCFSFPEMCREPNHSPKKMDQLESVDVSRSNSSRIPLYLSN